MFKTQNYAIYNNDCIQQLKKLQQDKLIVDAIITDPPYNISKENNFATMKNATRQGVDFGEWDKGADLYSWINYADPLLKNGGNIIIFNSFLHIGEIAKYLENKNYQIKDVIRWIKTNPMPRNMKRRFVADYEFAIWCVKGKGKWTFNNEKQGYLIPEIKTALTPKSEKIERGHPTQKPILLMQEIIKILTNENDIILDPFMGSASTGIASLNLKRKFIGIELEKGYYQMAKDRLESIVSLNSATI